MADDDPLAPGTPRQMRPRYRRRVAAVGATILIALLIGYWQCVQPAARTEVRAASAPLVARHFDRGDLFAALPPRSGKPRPTDCESGAPTLDTAPDAVGRRERAAAGSLAAIAEELAGSASAADRALAQFVRMRSAVAAAHDAFAQRNPQCEQDPSCGPREDDAVLQSVRGHLDALARIASEGSDAGAYGLAFLACSGVDSPGGTDPCAQLSARQWAQIEPHNALPWLFVATEAARQSQASLVADAYFHAAQAQHIDSHWGLFATALDARAVRGQGVVIRNDIALAVMDMAAAMRYPPFQPVFAYCDVDALADTNRRQVCDDLANLMTERSDTTTALVVGTQIGARLGWPASRLEDLVARRDAYRQLAFENMDGDIDTCAALERQRGWIGDAMAHGEIGAAQRALAASGQTKAQLAQREQRRHAALMAKAAATQTLEPGAVFSPP
jgi:hypothetical protein